MILLAEMSLLSALCHGIFAAEFLFYLLFHFVLVPRANRRNEPHVYRDYPVGQREKLLRRIFERIRDTCERTHRTSQEHKDVVQNFILQWFRENKASVAQRNSSVIFDKQYPLQKGDAPMAHESSNSNNPLVLLSVPLLTQTTTSSTDSSSLGSDSAMEDQDIICSDRVSYDGNVPLTAATTKEGENWAIPGLSKQDMDVFFAWGLFGKELHLLSDAEASELESFYPTIEEVCQGLHFFDADDDESTQQTREACSFIPRRPSLEDVNPIHRPLLVYLIILFIKSVICHAILIVLGFRRVQSQAGLVAWYRPARHDTCSLLPFLFFHGIAPAGLTFYLPMILHLIRDGRAAFLFENPPITYCSLGFDALTELETVQGVEEILSLTGFGASPLSLVGHSFGSCQLTWLLKSRQFVLLDPVTILLSEPDVMVSIVPMPVGFSSFQLTNNCWFCLLEQLSLLQRLLKDKDGGGF
jgi:hypothetical protein